MAIIELATDQMLATYLGNPSRAWKGVVLHHTWRPTTAQYMGIETVKAIRKYHEGKHWRDIGYHFLFGPDGRIFTGRPLNWAGAHAIAQLPAAVKKYGNVNAPNQIFLGFCAIGDYDKETPSDKLKSSLQKVGEAAEAAFKNNGWEWQEHRFFQAKSCPGAHLWNFDWKEKTAMPDTETPSPWAAEAWAWAEQLGFITGGDPHGQITREQLAVILKRFWEEVKNP